MRRLFVIIVLMFAARVSAQTECDYYKGKESITAGGITYEVLYNRVLGLCNRANIYINEPNLYYQNGEMVENMEEYNAANATMQSDMQARAVREAFGDIRIKLLRKYYESIIRIYYVVGPNGDTLEVAFYIDALPELLSTPPSVFAKLESLLKKYVKWDVNETGKRLKFSHMGSHVNFHNIPLSSELAAIKKNDNSFESGLTPIE